MRHAILALVLTGALLTIPWPAGSQGCESETTRTYSEQTTHDGNTTRVEHEEFGQASRTCGMSDGWLSVAGTEIRFGGVYEWEIEEQWAENGSREATCSGDGCSESAQSTNRSSKVIHDRHGDGVAIPSAGVAVVVFPCRGESHGSTTAWTSQTRAAGSQVERHETTSRDRTNSTQRCGFVAVNGVEPDLPARHQECTGASGADGSEYHHHGAPDWEARRDRFYHRSCWSGVRTDGGEAGSPLPPIFVGSYDESHLSSTATWTDAEQPECSQHTCSTSWGFWRETTAPSYGDRESTGAWVGAHGAWTDQNCDYAAWDRWGIREASWNENGSERSHYSWVYDWWFASECRRGIGASTPAGAFDQELVSCSQRTDLRDRYDSYDSGNRTADTVERHRTSRCELGVDRAIVVGGTGTAGDGSEARVAARDREDTESECRSIGTPDCSGSYRHTAAAGASAATPAGSVPHQEAGASVATPDAPVAEPVMERAAWGIV